MQSGSILSCVSFEMIVKTVLLLLCCATGLLQGEQVRYDNYRVYEVSIADRTQLEALQYLERYPDGVSV